MGGRRAQAAGLLHFSSGSCTEGVHSSLEPFITGRTFPKCRIPGQRYLFSGSPTSLNSVSKLTHVLYHLHIFPVPSHTLPSFARCCQNCFDADVVTLLTLQQGSCFCINLPQLHQKIAIRWMFPIALETTGEVKGNCRSTLSAMIITGTKKSKAVQQLKQEHGKMKTDYGKRGKKLILTSSNIKMLSLTFN